MPFVRSVLIIAVLLGVGISIAGVKVDSLEPSAIWAGLAMMGVSSALLVITLSPTRSRFAREFLLLWFVGCCVVSLPFVPFLGVPFLLIAGTPLALPVLAVGLLIERSRGRLYGYQILAYSCALFVAPLAMLNIPTFKKYPEEAPIVLDTDDLADKNPAFIDAPEFWRKEAKTLRSHQPIEVNKSAAVVALDIAQFEHGEQSASDQQFTTYAEAMAYCDAAGLAWIPSVQLVDHKVKEFADAFMAAVELQLQAGSDVQPGMQAFIEMLTTVAVEQSARAAGSYLAAAASLGDPAYKLPAPVAEVASTLRDEFLSNALMSKPIGLYDQSPELAIGFRQDRFCQQVLDPQVATEIRRIIASSAALTAQYAWHLEARRILSNPPPDDRRALLADDGGLPVLFPPSDSKESALFRALYIAMVLPEENIMNRLIRSIRLGETDLTPEEDSGWYDHQVYALETLLVPEQGDEGEKLLLTAAYKERLVEAFRTMLTKQRELHVKRVGMMMRAGIDPESMELSPDLHVEPTASYYLRSAEAFRFVRKALAAHFGDAEFSRIALDDGTNLREATITMERLLTGLYLQVCDDLGMTPDEDVMTAVDRAAVLAEAQDWLASCREDIALAGDVRYIVPALSDPDGREVRYWMTTGIRLEKVKTEYARPPKVRVGGEVIAPGGWLDGEILSLAPQEVFLPVEVFAEATGPNVPYSRDEFRALCDDAGGHAAIIRAIERGQHGGPGLPSRWITVCVVVAAILSICAFILRQRRALS